MTYFHVPVRHDDVMKWKHFPRYWSFVRGIHWSPANSPHKGQWHGALMFSLICIWINGWVNNREAGDLRRHRAHYDVIVMAMYSVLASFPSTSVSQVYMQITRFSFDHDVKISDLRKSEVLNSVTWHDGSDFWNTWFRIAVTLWWLHEM